MIVLKLVIKVQDIGGVWTFFKLDFGKWILKITMKILFSKTKLPHRTGIICILLFPSPRFSRLADTKRIAILQVKNFESTFSGRRVGVLGPSFGFKMARFGFGSL